MTDRDHLQLVSGMYILPAETRLFNNQRNLAVSLAWGRPCTTVAVAGSFW